MMNILIPYTRIIKCMHLFFYPVINEVHLIASVCFNCNTVVHALRLLNKYVS